MNADRQNNQMSPMGLTLKVVLPIVLLAAFAAAQAQAQDQQPPSTDRDNPTALTSNIITADGVNEKIEYFYSFTAGPGDVTITLDVKAQKSTAVSSVDIVLYDAKSNRLLSTYANPDHGSSKRAVETAKVRGTQTLLLEVTVSPAVDNFKIKLDGAVQLTPPATTDSTTPSATPIPTPTPAAPPDATTMGASDTTEAATVAQQVSTTDGNAQVAAQSSDGTQYESGPSDVATQAGNGAQPGKVAKKINSATSMLNSLITAATSTTGSLKAAKQSIKSGSQQTDTQESLAQQQVTESSSAPAVTTQPDADQNGPPSLLTNGLSGDQPAQAISQRVSGPKLSGTAVTPNVKSNMATRPLPTLVGVASKNSASQPAAGAVGVNNTPRAVPTEPRLRRPQLTIKVQQNQDVVYYSLMVSNSSEFDARRFVVSRRLPPSPCNPQGVARLLLSYYSADGKQLGCRGLSGPPDLSRTSLRFLKKDAPSSVYVTLKDEVTRETVRSNVVAIGK